MADTTPALIWMCDKEGKVTYLNDRRIAFTGRDGNAGLQDVWIVFIHPDDVHSVQVANKRRWSSRRSFPRNTGSEDGMECTDGCWTSRLRELTVMAGLPVLLVLLLDITDQKLAQEALEKIGGKLIEAQEEERSRIARELHDDICQRLALLSMELEQANRGSSGSGKSPRIDEIRRHCAQIAGDVQALSHKLHSRSWSTLVWQPPSGVTVGICSAVRRDLSLRR